MVSFPVTVRYRYSDGGDADTAASFRGRFFDRSEAVVVSRLRELHRFAAWVEVIELRWEDAGPAVPPGRGAAGGAGISYRHGRHGEGSSGAAPASVREPAL
jgi:hypothetical protein